ncbi:MAG: hypothetical protein GX677_09695 [Treponema sp.]|nr:hypothetical protein [Treponema sp.]
MLTSFFILSRLFSIPFELKGLPKTISLFANRTDVQIKISKLIELMCRQNGASSKEICSELNCTQRTFYRSLQQLEDMQIPFYDKPDYTGATNSKRWFITERPIAGTQIFLSAEERFFLRIILEQNKNLSTNKSVSESILSKLNMGIFHDIDKRNYKLSAEELSLKTSLGKNTNINLFASAF